MTAQGDDVDIEDNDNIDETIEVSNAYILAH